MSLAAVFTSFSSFRSQQSSLTEQAPAAGKEQQTNTQGQASASQHDSVTIGANTNAEQTYAAPAVTPSLPGSESRTDAANNILNFIANRLRLDVAEGATPEQLASRLEAGLNGFLKGFQEAYDQLAGMGFLNEDVESAIEKTFTDVLGGVEAIADELQIALPDLAGAAELQAQRQQSYVAPEPASQRASDLFGGVLPTGFSMPANAEAENLSNLIDASTYKYRESESRSFNFELKTQDGDSVTIRAAFASVSMLDGERVSYAANNDNGSATGSAVSTSGGFRAASGFYLEVQGDLDEDELMAIEDLLVQVREVSDMFFGGDIEAAFNHATELGFNSDEIAEFSLNLRLERSVSIRETYQQYLPDNNASSSQPVAASGPALDKNDDKIMLMARFVQALEDMRIAADKLGLSGFEALLVQNEEDAGEVSSNSAAASNINTHKGPEQIVQSLLTSLEKL